jgi:hypothetical protein
MGINGRPERKADLPELTTTQNLSAPEHLAWNFLLQSAPSSAQCFIFFKRREVRCQRCLPIVIVS